MSIIVVSDIFGKTPALIRLAEEINASAIVDPYDGNNMNFADEAEAYSYFMKNVGLDTYLEKLQKVLHVQNSSSTLVGFSIGASIIWKLSDTLSSKHVKNAICFYGSQIRNFTHINPSFNIELILPKYEEHFDVDKLHNRLGQKKNVKILRVNCLHGFMNYYSTHYDEEEYTKQIKSLSFH